MCRTKLVFAGKRSGECCNIFHLLFSNVNSQTRQIANEMKYWPQQKGEAFPKLWCPTVLGKHKHCSLD